MVGGDAVDVDNSVCETVFVTGANFVTLTELRDVGAVLVVLFMKLVFVTGDFVDDDDDNDGVVIVDDDFVDLDVDVVVDAVLTIVVVSIKQTSMKRNCQIIHVHYIKSSFTNQ